MRPTCDGAGRTFVQDGFDARTGDEREPREQPGGREREASTLGESEREGRREKAHRPAKWRKGERGRPNGASLSSATGLRNTHIGCPPARSCTLRTQSLTVNRKRTLKRRITTAILSKTKIRFIGVPTCFTSRYSLNLHDSLIFRSNFT